jgi:hypothetical protein
MASEAPVANLSTTSPDDSELSSADNRAEPTHSRNSLKAKLSNGDESHRELVYCQFPIASVM